MDTLRLIRDLFDHMEWADAEVWRAVLATPPAAADWIVRDRQFTNPKVQQELERAPAIAAKVWERFSKM